MSHRNSSTLDSAGSADVPAQNAVKKRKNQLTGRAASPDDQPQKAQRPRAQVNEVAATRRSAPLPAGDLVGPLAETPGTGTPKLARHL